MIEAFGKLVLLFEEDIYDYLGTIYMKCQMGNSKTGQFFTPFNLSELSAKIAGKDYLKQLKETDEIIWMNEPTCGGGSMILALIKYLKENEINYQKRLRIVAQDLDFRSVYMAYIQLSLVGANALVQQGDTLIEPNVYESNRLFYTPIWKGM